MSAYGRGNALEKWGRKKRAIALFAIKLKVSLLMLFFKKASIERKQIDQESIEELKDWSNGRNLTFKVQKTSHPTYIYTQHSAVETGNYETRFQLHFSK